MGCGIILDDNGVITPRKRSYSIDQVLDSPAEERLTLNGVGATKRTSLALPYGMTISSWKRVGKQICVLSEASTWWLGDWLVYGQENFPDRYKRVMQETSLDYQTLRNYAWIARKFPAHRRRERLSFQHHAEVAVFGEEEQELWLTRAGQFRWSRNELRRQIRASMKIGDQKAVETAQVRLKVTPSQHEHWLQAAQEASQGLEEWVTKTLDVAATGSTSAVTENQPLP